MDRTLSGAVLGALVAVAFGCGSSKKSTPGGSGDAGTGGQLYYDSRLDVFWLADANFAASSTGRAIAAAARLTGIAADGTMNYATAISWVNALNTYPQLGCANGQVGYLCHSDWQLPVTPNTDPTCTVHAGTDGNSFGPNCTGSALGSLFYGTLGFTYPASVASGGATVGPFKNLITGLYWTSDTNGGGEVTFSFLIDIKFSNTTGYNLLRVLPMSPGAIGNSPPSGTGAVRPYVSGPAAGLAVYDSVTGNSWALDANLAATNAFGVTGTLSDPASGSANAITMPLRAPDGLLHFTAVTNWLSGMNASSYAGASNWTLPSFNDISTLFLDAGMQADDLALLSTGATGPFINVQPFFYWACPQMAASSPSQCDYTANGGMSGTQVMQFAFNFDTGFQGTDMAVKRFFTIVYRPNR